MKGIMSVCPICLRKIRGQVLVKDDGVHLFKVCREHGFFDSLVDSDTSFYEACHDQPYHRMRPRRLDIPVTYRCNLSCSFCYSAVRKGPDISFDQIRKFIDDFPGDYVTLSGGEPTLRPDLFDIIRLVVSRRKIPTLNTNGLNLVDEEYVRGLRDAGLKVVHLTVSSLKCDPYNPNGEAIARQKVKAFHMLKKHGIFMVLSFLLKRGVNEPDIVDLLNLSLDNPDCVAELRIRSANLIGKHQDIGIYSTSQILELLCGIVHADKEELVAQMRELKFGKCLCKFTGYFFFLDDLDHYLGARVISRTGRLTPLALLVRLGQQPFVDWYQRHGGMKVVNLLPFLGRKGLSLAAPVAKGLLQGKRLRSVKVEIRSWPNRYNVDLADVINCPSYTSSPDHSRMMPFCYRFFCEEGDVMDVEGACSH